MIVCLFLGYLITTLMKLPAWVLQYREPKTEIRNIKGGYYKYAVAYQYNPLKKRTDKVTKHLLGKITPEQGFVPSEKRLLKQSNQSIARIDIKTYGVYHLFTSLIAEELQSLQTLFDNSISAVLLAVSMMRFAHQCPLKRISYLHAHDFCSQYWSTKGLDDKKITAALKFTGENRNRLLQWMRSRTGIDQSSSTEEHFVMIDSTHIPSLSENLYVNAVGYNPQHSYDPQIRLMYIFSAQIKQPIYYRLISGNVTDVKSMKQCITELGVNNVIFIADKGFYSKANVKEIKDNCLYYIIPLYRSSNLIDYTPLQQANFKKAIRNYFTYQGRIIWYYAYETEEQKLITFLDEVLRLKEENDYLQRTQTHPDQYSNEGFFEKMHQLGTLTLISHLPANHSEQEIYEIYKQRVEIEVLFDAYKNFLEADRTYMQNRYVMEGWLMANFIAMIAYYRLYQRLMEAKMLSKYSPKDMLEMSKYIYQTKIKDIWMQSEVTKKIADLFKKINIDYLT
jgi:transposase